MDRESSCSGNNISKLARPILLFISPIMNLYPFYKITILISIIAESLIRRLRWESGELMSVVVSN